jgi:uncharacterized repeat protein (TIGR01451 family)
MRHIWVKGKGIILSAALATAIAPLCNGGFSVFAETSTTTDTVITKDYSNNEPVQSSLSFYDAQGNIVPIGTTYDFDKDIASLQSTIKTGEMNASKNGAFASDTDAKDGIAELTFDVTGKTAPADYDVVFVLDESGSMNMCMSTAKDSKGRDIYYGERLASCPDQNKEHYYIIPAGMFGNAEDIPFRLKDLSDTSVFTNWGSLATIWDKVEETYHFSSGLSGTDAIKKWQPWKHLYKMVNGELVYIPMLQETNAKYTSPIGNTDGCFDRMMIEKEQTEEMATKILSSGGNTTVGVVGFSNYATTYTSTLTSDLSEVKNALHNYNGKDNTDYTAGLNAASALLNARTDKNRKAYVIFITDGEPYYGNGSDPQLVADQNEQGTAITNLKKNTGNTTVYAAGINSGEKNVENLREISSGEGYYNECNTTEDFLKVMQSILTELTSRPILTDTIGEDQEIYIDAKHPLTADGKEYTSLEDLPENIVYNADTKTVSWIVPEDKVNDGVRMTFFVKLAEDKMSLTSKNGTYATNGEADLSYHKSVNGAPEKDLTKVTLNTPLEKYEISHLPAVLTSDRMTNNNPDVTGVSVSDNDYITYTITLTNDGTLDTKDIAIKDYIPAHTTFDKIVSGSGEYLKDTNAIVWTVDEIKAGKTAQVQFRVKVDPVLDTKEIETIPDTFTWGWGTAKQYQKKNPVCLGNQLINPTPEDKNRFSPAGPDVPDTGDATHSAQAAGILIASLLMIAGVLITKKKYQN